MTPEIMQWAARHGISYQAMHELRMVMGLNGDGLSVLPDDIVSEAGVQSHVRLQAAQAGYLVWRNNSGAMQDETGRVVRYGLANDSAKLNKLVKSSDLVGIKPGGQFWCRECKPRNWQYTGTEREVAQLRFINLVLAQGGDAAFSTGGI